MRKILFTFMICAALFLAMPATARADMGPKPSVQITFTGTDGRTYYGTLLSQHRSTGPASAWDGYSEPNIRDQDGGEEIWSKFASYEDIDGFYFLQEWWKCSENDQLNWIYYPPTPFKILLYFPENDAFYISPIYESYAFDSYFTVDLSEYQQGSLTAKKSYDYTWELISFGARMVCTILLELAIALLFGYRGKKVLTFLAIVNIFTQLALNIVLNLVNYNSGPFAFMLVLIPLELAVLMIEAVLYVSRLPAYSAKTHPKARAAAYALAANAASYESGLWLAYLIPGIF